MPRTIDKSAFFAKIGYTPHSSGQAEFHSHPARFKIPVCGRRYGKSTMAGRDFEPDLFVPKGRYWIVGPTYDLGEKEFRVIWDDLIVGQKLGKDKRVKKAYNKRSGEMYIEFPWQTRLEVRSAEHPENLVGEALDGVILSEAAKHKKETWERFVRPALADRRGKAMFPTTPEGFNWLYEIWQLGQDAGQPHFKSWKFPSWENIVVYPGGRQDEEILLLEKTTTPEWFMQEIGADFASFVGKIYGEFDETVHVRRHTFRPEWENYLAIDWGYTNPLAAIEFQVSPMGKVYVWREHYKSYTMLSTHIEMWKRGDYTSQLGVPGHPPGYHLDCCFGDAADPEATMVVASSFAPCISLPEAKTNWRQGVDEVKKLLKPQQVGEIDEYGTPKTEPWLYVDPSCVNTMREFNNYRGRAGTKVSDAKDMAQKIDDHAMDALRYGIVHRFILGAQHHLSEVYDDSRSSGLFIPGDDRVLIDSLIPANEPAPESGFFELTNRVF